MLLTAQIWDAQKQELAGRVGATSRRIASKVAEVLHAGKTATRRQGHRFKLGTKTSGVAGGRCPLWVKSRHVQRKSRCPLYTRKRRIAHRAAMLIKGRNCHDHCCCDIQAPARNVSREMAREHQTSFHSLSERSRPDPQAISLQ